MTFHGAPGFNTAEDGPPFSIEALIGMRCWAFAPDAVLRSPLQSYEWKAGVNVAEHPSYTWLGRPDDHTPRVCPDRSCSAGFYAYHGEDYWFGSHNGNSSRPWLNGLIAGWGRVVNGPKGFRCGKATIVALCEPIHLPAMSATTAESWEGFTEVAVARLREDFPTVPLFGSVAEMLDALPLTGRRSAGRVEATDA